MTDGRQQKVFYAAWMSGKKIGKQKLAKIMVSPQCLVQDLHNDLGNEIENEIVNEIGDEIDSEFEIEFEEKQKEQCTHATLVSFVDRPDHFVELGGQLFLSADQIAWLLRENQQLDTTNLPNHFRVFV
jgi:chromosomal replication initiation ATPase DnaA